jgi:hypothetical protein
MPVFEKGHPKIGGRVKGTRNRLGTVILEKLLRNSTNSGKRRFVFAASNVHMNS